MKYITMVFIEVGVGHNRRDSSVVGVGHNVHYLSLESQQTVTILPYSFALIRNRFALIRNVLNIPPQAQRGKKIEHGSELYKTKFG